MKVINRTRYNTTALRSMMTAVHNAEPRGRLAQWGAVVVTVRYARAKDRPYTGRAVLRGARCLLSIPRPGTTYEAAEHAPNIEPGPAAGLAVVKFCALWRHEMWHLHGLNHGDYPPGIMYCRDECVSHVDLSRFEDLDIEPAKPKAKPKGAERQRIKVARLLARRVGWASKLNRAATAIAKIDRSLAYYAREGIEEAEAANRKPER